MNIFSYVIGTHVHPHDDTCHSKIRLLGMCKQALCVAINSARLGIELLMYQVDRRDNMWLFYYGGMWSFPLLCDMKEVANTAYIRISKTLNVTNCIL